MQRRTFLQGSLAGGAVAVAVGAGLLSPRSVLAAWPEGAFNAKSVQDAMSGLFGSADSTASGDIKIKAPDIAENGAVVPVTVSTSLADVESISVLVEKNPTPLVAMFELSPQSVPDISVRIKMGESSKVQTVVKAGGKLYSASKEVKVTIGGCGG